MNSSCPRCAADRHFLPPFAPCSHCGHVPHAVAGAVPVAPPEAVSVTPSRGMPITSGVLAIVASSLIFLSAVAFLVAASELGIEIEGLTPVMAVLALVAGFAILAGAFACASRPGWVLTSAILQGCFAVLFLLSLTGGGGGGGVFLLILSGLASVFGFVGVRAARNYQRFRAGAGIDEVFR